MTIIIDYPQGPPEGWKAKAPKAPKKKRKAPKKRKAQKKRKAPKPKAPPQAPKEPKKPQPTSSEEGKVCQDCGETFSGDGNASVNMAWLGTLNVMRTDAIQDARVQYRSDHPNSPYTVRASAYRPCVFAKRCEDPSRTGSARVVPADKASPAPKSKRKDDSIPSRCFRSDCCPPVPR